jgi:hypothetical protein
MTSGKCGLAGRGVELIVMRPFPQFLQLQLRGSEVQLGQGLLVYGCRGLWLGVGPRDRQAVAGEAPYTTSGANRNGLRRGLEKFQTLF